MSISLQRTSMDYIKFYDKHVDTIYRIALMMLNNVPEAEDVTQTAFIKLMTSNKDFENDEHVKAWLIVTTRNICRNLLKSWWRVKRVDMETIAEQPVFEISDSEIWSIVSGLDEKYQLSVYLHYYEGYKTEEVASILGVNHATIRTRLRTARKKLKLILEDDNSECKQFI